MVLKDVVVLRVSVGRHNVIFASRGVCSFVSSFREVVRMVMKCCLASSNVLCVVGVVVL